MSNLILQQFEGHSVRIVQKGDDVWFVLADVCRVLGTRSPSSITKVLDADEKGLDDIVTPGGVQQMLTTNESGVYTVILRSNKPIARKFRKWVTNEVLPSIRQTGSYSAAPAPVDFSALQQLADLVPQAIEARVQVAEARMEAQIEEWEARQPINSVQKGQIHRAVKELALLMGGKPRDFRRAWTAFKDHYGLAAYPDLPSGKYDDALRFISKMAAAYENPRALEFVNA